MKTRRQQTNQDAQRARVSQRRRSRHPADHAHVMQHGERSQSGVKVRSVAAWQAHQAYQRILRGEQRRLEAMRAGWRERAAAKRAARG